MKTIHIFGLVFSLLCCGMLYSEEPMNYSVDFAVLPWKGMQPPRGIYYESEGKVNELRFQRVRRSPVYHYEGPSPLIFFRKESGITGENIRIPVAKADLTQKIGHPLLLFAMRQGQSPSDPEFGVVVLDDSPESFPEGSYKLFNLCSDTLYCKVGTQTESIERHGQWIAEPANRGAPVDAVVLKQNEDALEQVYRSQWPTTPGQRTLVFFFPASNPGAGVVDTFVVSDYVLMP